MLLTRSEFGFRVYFGVLIRTYYKLTIVPTLGVLKVEGEIRDGAPTPPPNQDAIPNLAGANFYIGGVPPGFKAPITLPGSFLGCMADIQVMQEGYNLIRNQFWGIQASCSEKVDFYWFVFFTYCKFHSNYV